MQQGPGLDSDRLPHLSTSPPPPTSLPRYPLKSRPLGRVLTRLIGSLSTHIHGEALNASSGHVGPQPADSAHPGGHGKRDAISCSRCPLKRLSHSPLFALPAGAAVVPNHHEVGRSYLGLHNMGPPFANRPLANRPPQQRDTASWCPSGGGSISHAYRLAASRGPLIEILPPETPQERVSYLRHGHTVPLRIACGSIPSASKYFPISPPPL
ncbi:hypothetical protein PLEOSDRAFT_1106253 [Pleurotus ostreatus PC15]|uniref:Uncharacterized protein n=1 Tax=Pleurotus ostreatus (strain PC15) TaxID=1137138 RepID=A0A067NMK1_PLEO1|nr:hypothetical protein PLEOSDRAFT_1106250 [Pleurotus ostreatus PC15]KDQ25312.1 hypothetical protein PLEOSDRAFT_1106253 [Pleurotus ostreatus PC15]